MQLSHKQFKTWDPRDPRRRSLGGFLTPGGSTGGGGSARVLKAGATNTDATNWYAAAGAQWSYMYEQILTRPWDIKAGDQVPLRIPTHVVSSQTGINIFSYVDEFKISHDVDFMVQVAPTWIYQQDKSSLSWNIAPGSVADGGGNVVHYLAANYDANRPFMEFLWNATQDIPANTPFGARTFHEFVSVKQGGAALNLALYRAVNNDQQLGRFEGFRALSTSMIDAAIAGTFTPSQAFAQASSTPCPIGIGAVIAPAPADALSVAIFGNSEEQNGALDGFGQIDISGGYGDYGGNMKGSRSYSMRLWEKLGVLHTQHSKGSDADFYRMPAKVLGTIVTKTSTSAGATTSGTALAVNTTSIPVAAAGSGAIAVGDFVQFPNDLNIYKVTTGVANVGAGGTMIITPGLKVAVPASAVAITPCPAVLTQTKNYLGAPFAGDTISTTVAGQKVISNSVNISTVVSYGLLLPETVSTPTVFTARSHSAARLKFLSMLPGLTHLHYMNDTNEMAKALMAAAPWTAAQVVYPYETRYTGGFIYFTKNGGTCGSTAPTGTGKGISDGGVIWDCISPDDLAGSRAAAGIIANRAYYLDYLRTFMPSIKLLDVTTSPITLSTRAPSTGTSYAYNSSTGALVITFADVTDFFVGNTVQLNWASTPPGFSAGGQARKAITAVDATNKTITLMFATGLTAPTQTLTSVGMGAPSIASQQVQNAVANSYTPGTSMRTAQNRYKRNRGTAPYNDVAGMATGVVIDWGRWTEANNPLTPANETGVWPTYVDGGGNKIAWAYSNDLTHGVSYSYDNAAAQMATPDFLAAVKAA